MSLLRGQSDDGQVQVAAIDQERRLRVAVDHGDMSLPSLEESLDVLNRNILALRVELAAYFGAELSDMDF